MTNESTLLTENQGLFSPISHLFFEYYSDSQKITEQLEQNEEVQCIIGNKKIGFGEAQNPGLFFFFFDVDTMQFLLTI